jgi:hypothetical protein
MKARALLSILCIFMLIFVNTAKCNCKEEFNKLLKYKTKDGKMEIDDKAFTYYVSMPKHLYDLGNYDYFYPKF